MYQEHPDFEVPKNTDSKMWRYMTLPKFLSLLENSSLYFTRSDKFADPFEGTIPKINEEEIAKYFSEYENSEEMHQQLLNIFKTNKKVTLINCWYLSDYESDAMWQLYSDNGVAIQTTFKKFKNAISSSSDKIFTGQVKYIDYDKEGFLYLNALSSFLYKRISFEHEKEIRAVIWNTGEIKEGEDESVTEIVDHGKYSEINLNDLIESIYVSPTAPSWFYHLIISLLKRYNLGKPVLHSKLYSIDDIEEKEKELNAMHISKEILDHFSKKDSYRINEEKLKSERERLREYEYFENEIKNFKEEIADMTFSNKKNIYKGKEALYHFSRISYSKSELTNIFGKSQFKKLYFIIGKIDNYLRDLNSSDLGEKEKIILTRKMIFFYSEYLAEATIYLTIQIEKYQISEEHLQAVLRFTKDITKLMIDKQI